MTKSHLSPTFFDGTEIRENLRAPEGHSVLSLFHLEIRGVLEEKPKAVMYAMAF